MTIQPADPFDVDSGGQWMRPAARRAELRADAILALVVAIGASATVTLYSVAKFFDEPTEPWKAVLMVLGISGPLVWRRVYPITVTIVVSGVYVAGVYNSVPEVLFSNIAIFAGLYSIGAWGRSRRRALISRALIVSAMFLWLFWELTRAAFDTSLAPEDSGVGLIAPGVAVGIIAVITNILYFAGAWAFGNRAWAAARERAELQSRTQELARERKRTATQAVALDRVRIGRELHDVVAHHVSVMGVQAGAARRALASDREGAEQKATESLAAIEQSARQAVDELHRLVSTLRDSGETEGDADDGPSTRMTAQLPQLVDEVRATGRAVSMTIVGDCVPLGPLIDTTLYRIAREAVTNSLKHGGASAALEVRLRFSPEVVELEVADTGLGARAVGARGVGTGATSSRSSTGLGQVGMRERLAAVGGTLEAGPRSRGGYLVRASVPLIVAEGPA